MLHIYAQRLAWILAAALVVAIALLSAWRAWGSFPG